MTEWENQQIRKGVTGAQLVSAQQESIYVQLLTKTAADGHRQPHSLQADDAASGGAAVSTGTKLAQAYARSATMDRAHQLLTGSANTTNAAKAGGGPRMPNEVQRKLRDRLQQVRELHEKHVDELEQIGGRLAALTVTETENTANAPVAAVKYRFYQELRGYVTDLVECLDEKLPVIVELERRALAIMARQATLLIERRRQDVRDQAKEIAEAGSECGRLWAVFVVVVARLDL